MIAPTKEGTPDPVQLGWRFGYIPSIKFHLTSSNDILFDTKACRNKQAKQCFHYDERSAWKATWSSNSSFIRSPYAVLVIIYTALELTCALNV
jgi:hypothetical protein